jgi:hypothetical protein
MGRKSDLEDSRTILADLETEIAQVTAMLSGHR